MDKEALTQEFMVATGCEKEEAEFYLESSEWNLNVFYIYYLIECNE